MEDSSLTARDPFTGPEYRALLVRYREARAAYAERSYRNPADVGAKDALKAELSSLAGTYWQRLPSYLLARCPICGGAVREAVDTYSLNGLGWRNRMPDGFGWRSGTFYRAECSHAQIVGYGLNLNGMVPDDVTQWVGIGSERPYVMARLIALADTYVVMHALGVGRADGRPGGQYTLYFTTYFTDDDAFQAAIRSFHQEQTLLVPGLGDYDLLPWVAQGKLMWLDPADDARPLRQRDVATFPYGKMEGVVGMWFIHRGRLHMLHGPKGQRPRGHTAAE